MSGLGKGVVTSSIAKLLQLGGYRVSCIKIDPYVNYDAGTMNPVAHGEVFVTDDGGECDMDIGNYERFIDRATTRDHNITTGRIYMDVIKREREGKYLGQCVQIIPHVTDAIKDMLKQIAVREKLDIIVVECGGTVGDIESLPFLEALRQMKLELGEGNCLFAHVTLAPSLDVVGEQKTKPTQHSVQELRRIGIQPDLLAIRCKSPLSPDAARKISLFASVHQNCVISCHDTQSIYKVPEILEQQGTYEVLAGRLGLRKAGLRWGDWKSIASSFVNSKGSVRIAVVGKYVTLPDSYVSVSHALSHAAASMKAKAEIDWIDSERFENTSGEAALSSLASYDGILVPGGFGARGSEGIIKAANYACEKDIPYLGICFGFQLAIVAYARYRCEMAGANSTELGKTDFPVVDLLPEQREVRELGGTMRLGSHEVFIKTKSNAERIYNSSKINRRHRHRYEFNRDFEQVLTSAGMVFSAHSDGGKRTEILEVPANRFYFAVQYHAEFSSRPGKPEQSFAAFVRAAIERSHFLANSAKEPMVKDIGV